MTTLTPRHQQIEQQFRAMLRAAGLPEPDDVAQLRLAIVFLWYETKAFVLVDLEGLPEDADVLEGFDVERLREDLTVPLGLPGIVGGFADAA